MVKLDIGPPVKLWGRYEKLVYGSLPSSALLQLSEHCWWQMLGFRRVERPISSLDAFSPDHGYWL